MCTLGAPVLLYSLRYASLVRLPLRQPILITSQGESTEPKTTLTDDLFSSERGTVWRVEAIFRPGSIRQSRVDFDSIASGSHASSRRGL